MSLGPVCRPHQNPSQRSTSSRGLPQNRLETIVLQPAIPLLSFELSRETNVQRKVMKIYLALSLMISLAVSIPQLAQAAPPRGGKENEANRLARDGAEAAKNQ